MDFSSYNLSTTNATELFAKTYFVTTDNSLLNLNMNMNMNLNLNLNTNFDEKITWLELPSIIQDNFAKGTSSFEIDLKMNNNLTKKAVLMLNKDGLSLSSQSDSIFFIKKSFIDHPLLDVKISTKQENLARLDISQDQCFLFVPKNRYERYIIYKTFQMLKFYHQFDLNHLNSSINIDSNILGENQEIEAIALRIFVSSKPKFQVFLNSKTNQNIPCEITLTKKSIKIFSENSIDMSLKWTQITSFSQNESSLSIHLTNFKTISFNCTSTNLSRILHNSIYNYYHSNSYSQPLKNEQIIKNLSTKSNSKESFDKQSKKDNLSTETLSQESTVDIKVDFEQLPIIPITEFENISDEQFVFRVKTKQKMGVKKETFFAFSKTGVTVISNEQLSVHIITSRTQFHSQSERKALVIMDDKTEYHIKFHDVTQKNIFHQIIDFCQKEAQKTNNNSKESNKYFAAEIINLEKKQAQKGTIIFQKNTLSIALHKSNPIVVPFNESNLSISENPTSSIVIIQFQIKEKNQFALKFFSNSQYSKFLNLLQSKMQKNQIINENKENQIINENQNQNQNQNQIINENQNQIENEEKNINLTQDEMQSDEFEDYQVSQNEESIFEVSFRFSKTKILSGIILMTQKREMFIEIQESKKQYTIKKTTKIFHSQKNSKTAKIQIDEKTHFVVTFASKEKRQEFTDLLNSLTIGINVEYPYDFGQISSYKMEFLDTNFKSVKSGWILLFDDYLQLCENQPNENSPIFSYEESKLFKHPQIHAVVKIESNTDTAVIRFLNVEDCDKFFDDLKVLKE
ncbi:hypothetical protein M0811_11354 [Anaeramoeba ignava]|uniref:Uncharacterized protein n=1 Tax=Anaeramoeba ignava TaxID=1746090 RepID=A0A9Q0R8R8_ANAIG|nr:hypothetical protein M0811_11354 [Anaeramoeba ignava]